MSVDASGQLYYATYSSGKVGVIDTRTAPWSPSCKTLDAEKRNPCVFEYDVKGAFVAQHGAEYPGVEWAMPSVFVDQAGLVWFGGAAWFPGAVTEPGAPAATGPHTAGGYIKPTTGEIVFLPALDERVLYARDPFGHLHPIPQAAHLRPAANGIDLWVIDYYGRKVFLLRKLS
jgi:hypothetical protein